VSEAELIGGGIVNRNWEDAEEDGIGSFKKVGCSTHMIFRQGLDSFQYL